MKRLARLQHYSLSMFHIPLKSRQTTQLRKQEKMKKKIGYVSIALLSVAFILGIAPAFKRTSAQTSMQGMDMSVAPENVIDGSQHPEKINDTDAYRMFLLAATLQDGSDAEL